MKREAITKLDLNFSNAGGGHTASVSTVVDGKTLDGKDGLGTVLGEVGDPNQFSNTEIASAMGRFICTQVTTSTSPTKKTKTRRYADKTSLMLESTIVLVRGIGCGPEGGEAERNIAYYSEVPNSPLNPFKSMGPKRNGSIIEVGRIYNQEAAAAYSGVKIGLIYNDKTLKKELSLNLDFVSDSYEASPDLSQFELKFGYTLIDFKEMLGMAGIAVKGLPENESVLFETSGTLASVVSSVASYLGFFWYIDPTSGSVQFIDTQTASALTVNDYTDSEDPNITNASFTQSKLTNKIINTYSGTTERKEAQASGAYSATRSRNSFFKNVKVALLPQFKAIIGHNELGTFFELFNQEVSTDIFDKYTYACLLLAFTPPDTDSTTGESFFFKKFGGQESHWKDFSLKGTDEYPLYRDEPRSRDKLSYQGFAKDDANTTYSIFSTVSTVAPKVAKLTKLRLFPNRIDDKFVYHNMNNRSTLQKMPRASSSPLYTLLKAYFSIAGGVFVSNGYSQYKADRMQFTNTNNITICGPFKGDEHIHNLPELAPLDDVFRVIGIKSQTIRTLAEFTSGRAKIVNDYFFVALRTYPKLERPPIERDGPQIKPIDFTVFNDSTEIVEDFPNKPNQLYIGGPNEYWHGYARHVLDMVAQSVMNYRGAVERKNVLSLKYQRSKTKVNKKSDEGEEAEDDAVAESSEGDQQLSDLFDRFDTRYWGIEQPLYNILNKLALSGSSGTTVEMKALREVRGSYRDGSYMPSSSSRTLYGLKIPKLTPIVNSISVSVSSNGITTTVNESTIKIIPPDQSFLQTRGMEALTPKSNLTKGLSAGQRNILGL
tara:strand:- start:343 stop:2826 length:2484 start_codon:yes stop_codon:yes gene_type:complete